MDRARTSDFTHRLPSYLDRLPCVKHAWADASEAIATARSVVQSSNDNEHIELEARFSTQNHTNHFSPGISETAFIALEKRLDTCRDWAAVKEWHNISSFFHASAIAGDTRKLRTEVTFPSKEEEDQEKDVEPEKAVVREKCAGPHIVTQVKELVCKHDYRTVSLKNSGPSVPPAEIRIAVNREKLIADADIPEDVETMAVHLKERKCYYYASTDCDRPIWCYMLTKRWKGVTYQDARIAKERHPPEYEVELECVDPLYLVEKDPGRLAVNIFSKACDILGIIEPDLRTPTDYMIESSRGVMLWARGKTH